MKKLVALMCFMLVLTACAKSEKPVQYQRSSAQPSVSSSVEDYGIGMPPIPDKGNRTAYLGELNRIDPDIVHGQEVTAVERGRNQCSSVFSFPNDEAKLVELTNQRFTSPKHPDGFGTVKASKILVAVRKYLCPNF